MKHLYTILSLIFTIHCFGQVGINTHIVHPSAILEISGTNKGLLLPRLNTTERNNITSPSIGLLIYNTDVGCFEMYTGSSWNTICGQQDLCEFSPEVSIDEVSAEQGGSASISIVLNEIGGTPGQITTTLDNVADLPGISVSTITNNPSTVLPITKSVAIEVNDTTPFGDYILRFKHEAQCGVARYSVVTLHVTACNFSMSLAEISLRTSPKAITLYNQLNIEQSGNTVGIATISILTSHPSITASVLNSTCAYSCARTLEFQVDGSVNTGVYPYIIEVVSNCGYTDTVQMSVEVGVYRTCKEILDNNPGSSDGIYAIDPDGGLGTLPSMSCYCDMTTDGGGWTLIMNYVHKNGTNPALNIMNSTLPIPTIPTPSLGTDESSDLTKWGHASPDLLLLMPFSEFRFYGKTSYHSRILHFKTSALSGITYAKTGSGQFFATQINSTSTALSGNTSIMFGQIDNTKTNQGDLALSNEPIGYYVNPIQKYMWDVGINWQMDDSEKSHNLPSTIHMIWVR